MYEKVNKGNWVVVKTEINRQLIKTDFIHNRVKFRNGMVLYVGDISSSGEFIYSNIKKKQHYFSREGNCIKKYEIVGTKKWFKKYYNKN